MCMFLDSSLTGKIFARLMRKHLSTGPPVFLAKFENYSFTITSGNKSLELTHHKEKPLTHTRTQVSIPCLVLLF